MLIRNISINVLLFLYNDVVYIFKITDRIDLDLKH